MYYKFVCWHNGTALVSIYRWRTYQEKNDIYMLIHYNYIKNNDLGLYRVVCRRYKNVAEWCYMKTKEGNQTLICVDVWACMSSLIAPEYQQYQWRSADIREEHVLLSLCFIQSMVAWPYLLPVMIILIVCVFVIISECLCYPGC